MKFITGQVVGKHELHDGGRWAGNMKFITGQVVGKHEIHNGPGGRER